MQRDETWDAFARAVVTIEMPDGAKRLEPRPIGDVGTFPFAAPVHIITAHNPAGERDDALANERRHEELTQLLLVDAGVAEDGECQFDLLGPEIAVATREIAAANGGMLPAPNRDTPVFPLAVASMETPIRLQGPLPSGVPRVLVLATGNSGYHHRQAAERRGRPDWTIIEMDCGHNVLGERTDELVELLCRVASGAPAA